MLLFDSLLEFLWANPENKGFCLLVLPWTEPLEIVHRGYYVISIIFSGWVISRVFHKLMTKQVENRVLRNYLENIINSMPSLLIGFDSEMVVTLWNAEAVRFTGIPEGSAVGHPLPNFFDRLLSFEKIRTSLQTQSSLINRKCVFKTAGGTRYIDVFFFPLVPNGVYGGVLRITDVTEQVKFEEIMIQSEKMMSVGGLAAGMAHEINNPLAGIMQTASVLESRLCPKKHVPANLRAAEAAGIPLEAIEAYMKERGIPRMVNNIQISGERLAGIVSNMLSFARKRGDRKSTHNLVELIEKTIELARTDYDLKKQYDFKFITIRKEYEPSVPVVPCEQAKIQQVLLNILRNGAEAMHDGGIREPEFVIRTFLDKERMSSCVEIFNNGPPLSDEEKIRIFEPFFTTKPVGMGTGLGMSVSYFIIVNDHGGEISVESGEGSGVKFIIKLPINGGG